MLLTLSVNLIWNFVNCQHWYYSFCIIFCLQGYSAQNHPLFIQKFCATERSSSFQGPYNLRLRENREYFRLLNKIRENLKKSEFCPHKISFHVLNKNLKLAMCYKSSCTCLIPMKIKAKLLCPYFSFTIDDFDAFL